MPIDLLFMFLIPAFMKHLTFTEKPPSIKPKKELDASHQR
jgi:hypothetical protein